MQLKKNSFINKQITFGLLGLKSVFSEQEISAALKTEGLTAARKQLISEAKPEYKKIVEFIFDNLFSTEEDMDRIGEVFADIDSVEKEPFISSYRYRDTDMSDNNSSGCIEKIVSAIIAETNPSNVLDLCSGQGVFLSEAIRNNIAENYYGIEISREQAMISKVKMLIIGKDPESIKEGDVFDLDNSLNVEPKGFDAIFCHMPMNAALDTDKLVKNGLINEHQAIGLSRRDTEWAYIKAMQKLICKQNRGIAIALVRAGILFSDAGRMYRREILRGGGLEGVILLPPGLLSNTTVQTALIIMRPVYDTVKMVDASSYFTKGRRMNDISDADINNILDLYFTGGKTIPNDTSGEYVEVSIHDIRNDDCSYEPTKYILKETIEFNNEAKLEDVTTKIFRGVQIKADAHDSMSELYKAEPNCFLLSLSDISNGYIEDSLEEVHIEHPEKFDRYKLQPNDVVISARGTKISVAVADSDESREIIVTGNLAVIRCGEKLNPYYLKTFLESSNGMAMLNSAQTGSSIFAINPRQLQRMSIELFDIERQNLIGEKSKWMIGELKESHKRIYIVKEKLTHLFDEMKEV